MNIRKIKLVSNSICFGPIPEPSDEVEQRLTITDKGKVVCSRHSYQADENGNDIIEKLKFTISQESIERIFKKLEECIQENKIDDVCDVGTWTLYVYFNSDKMTISGPLLSDSNINMKWGNLSRTLRDELNVESLYAFDGNAGEEYVWEQ